MEEKAQHKETNKKKFAAGFSAVYFLLGVAVLLVVIVIWSKGFVFNDSLSDQEIVISTSRSTGASLLILANAKGFFAEEGINVELRYYPSAGAGLAAMLAGEIPIAAVAETPLIKQSFSRNDFRIFSTIASVANGPKIVARKSAGISKPGDLAGKQLGCTKAGQSAHFFLYLFLLQHHMTLQDIKLMHDSPLAISEMLLAGELDAVSLFEPHATRTAKVLGQEAIIFSSPGLYFKTYNLVARSEFLAESSEQTQSILKALLKAEEFYRSFPEESLHIIAEIINVLPEEITKLLDNVFLNINLSEELLITMKEEAGWMRETGLAPSTKILPMYSDFLDASCLRAVAPTRIMLSNE